MKDTALPGGRDGAGVPAAERRSLLKLNGAAWLSLTVRLALFAVAAAIPGFIALAWTEYNLRHERYREIQTQAELNTLAAVSELRQIVAGAGAVLNAISTASDIADLASTACHTYLDAVRSKTTTLETIGVTDAQGVIRCHSDELPAPASIADRDYFVSARESGGLAVGTFIKGRVSQADRLPLAYPIYRRGEFHGIVIAGLDLKWLNDHIKRRGLAYGSALTVADRNGVIIARQPLSERFVGTRIPEAYRSFVNASTSGSMEVVSQDGTPRILSYVPTTVTQIGMYVSGGASSDEALKILRESAKTSIALQLLGATAVLVLAWLVAERLLRRPIMQLVYAAQAWRAGNLSARTGISGRHDEIGLLGSTFDGLIAETQRKEEERNESEARRQILVNELAHRVKNSLATVQSLAALTFRKGPQQEKYAEFEGRIQSLVRSHDLLTHHHWRDASLEDTIRSTVEPHRLGELEQFKLEGPQVTLSANEVVAISMLIHELCTNAVKYGALQNGEGAVTISWSQRETAAGKLEVILTWLEKGGPPVPKDIKQGFGSSLMQSLARQLGGSFERRFEDTGVTCVITIVKSVR